MYEKTENVPSVRFYTGSVGKRTAAMFALAAWIASGAFALDPRKSLTQYSHTIWTQERGLPQDTIRAITQTKDGYLWLGTDEGLARFDGYEFVVFNKTNGDLPDNSITALAAANDGGLWIGTSNGLTQYRDGHFKTFTMKQGLPDAAITALHADHEGALWIVAGVYLSRYEDGQFTNFKPDIDIPVSSARAVYEDAHHDLWVAGFSRVVRRTHDTFVTVMQAQDLDGMVVLTMVGDRDGNIWIAGNKGIIRRSPAGAIQRYGMHEGLPDSVVRALWADRDGNIWAGTNNGMARLQGNRFVTSGQDDSEDAEGVRCLFEDREGDLWIGANGGLSRWRNDIFMVYGKREGLPSDSPNTVFQDRAGRVWVGFNDLGMMLFSGSRIPPVYLSRRSARQRRFSDSRRFEGRSADCHAFGCRADGGRKVPYLPPAGPAGAQGYFRRARGRAGSALAGDAGGTRRAPRQAVPERSRRRPAADRFRGHAFRGPGWSDLGRHLRQRTLARAGR